MQGPCFPKTIMIFSLDMIFQDSWSLFMVLYCKCWNFKLGNMLENGELCLTTLLFFLCFSSHFALVPLEAFCHPRCNFFWDVFPTLHIDVFLFSIVNEIRGLRDLQIVLFCVQTFSELGLCVWVCVCCFEIDLCIFNLSFWRLNWTIYCMLWLTLNTLGTFSFGDGTPKA